MTWLEIRYLDLRGPHVVVFQLKRGLPLSWPQHNLRRRLKCSLQATHLSVFSARRSSTVYITLLILGDWPCESWSPAVASGHQGHRLGQKKDRIREGQDPSACAAAASEIPVPATLSMHLHWDLVGPLPSSHGFTYCTHLFVVVDYSLC